MRRIAAFFVAVFLAVPITVSAADKQVYSTTWLDVFDTVTTLKGYEMSQAAFDAKANAVHTELQRYHQLFDVYNDYDGMVNLKTVNNHAGQGPIAVDAAILELLSDCRDFCELTGGSMNAAAGAVFALWHETREAALAAPEEAQLPDMQLLEEASAHCSFDSVMLDMEAGTVEITDPYLRLDVGAVAKGWAGQKVRSLMTDGYLLSLGGNICAVGSKPDGKAWNIGVQYPADPSQLMCTVSLRNTNAVTSGDYQRYYTVDGVRYHHIIDPYTLMPGTRWRSVTILCQDSGLADCLSTALFLLTLEEGTALAEKCGAEAMWVDAEENVYHTDGFPLNR